MLMRENEKDHMKNIEYIETVFLSKKRHKSKKEFIQASTYIKQLNDFIDDKIELSENKVFILLKDLYSNHSLHLTYELEKNIYLRRARKYEEKNVNNLSYCFSKTDELSIIPDKKRDIVGIGRLNKEKQPIYYGCLSEKSFNNYDVALAEVDAMECDYINFLDSIATEYLNVVRIGTFDLFMRGQRLYHWIDSYNLELFKFFKCGCNKINNPYLLESHQLCSAFFADILSRKNHKNLYKVTSTLANIIFENDHTDAIIYESVQVKGAPVIAIKPEALCKKVEHKRVASVKIVKNLGYGIYHVADIKEGTVEANQLCWEKIR